MSRRGTSPGEAVRPGILARQPAENGALAPRAGRASRAAARPVERALIHQRITRQCHTCSWGCAVVARWPSIWPTNSCPLMPPVPNSPPGMPNGHGGCRPLPRLIPHWQCGAQGVRVPSAPPAFAGVVGTCRADLAARGPQFRLTVRPWRTPRKPGEQAAARFGGIGPVTQARVPAGTVYATSMARS